MRKIAEKINNALICAQMELTRAFNEERGDTNFISIAIVLVVVLALAVVFIGFGNKLLPMLSAKINEIFNVLQ